MYKEIMSENCQYESSDWKITRRHLGEEQIHVGKEYTEIPGGKSTHEGKTNYIKINIMGLIEDISLAATDDDIDGISSS